MSKFIQPSDYDASIHKDILDSVTREDEAIIEVCEERAISEMRAYIENRYDCDALFAATGDDRQPLVLMMLIDITVYHLFCIHNPMKLSQMRKDRYDRAVAWMNAVNKGNVNITGAARISTEERKSQSAVLIRSNPKRINHM